MDDTGSKQAWVERVLGVAFPDTGPDRFVALWLRAKQRWQSAIEQVDGEIGQLQAALRSSDDATLHEIAEFGLNGVTGNHKVRLTVAITEIDRAGQVGRMAAVRKAIPLVGSFQDHIADDPRIAACDDNPFGVAVNVRATVSAALADLAAALKAA